MRPPEHERPPPGAVPTPGRCPPAPSLAGRPHGRRARAARACRRDHHHGRDTHDDIEQLRRTRRTLERPPPQGGRYFGWIAFVLDGLRARQRRGRGRVQRPTTTAPASLAAPSGYCPAPSPTARDETVLVSSRAAGASDPAFRAAVGRRRATHARQSRGAEGRLALRAGQRRPDRAERPCRARDAGAAQRRRRDRRRAAARRDRRRPARAPRPEDRAVRRRERRARRSRRCSPTTSRRPRSCRSRSRSRSSSSRSARSSPPGIPLLLALSSVMATLGLVAIGSHVIPVEDSVGSVVLLIGLAVGVDYSSSTCAGSVRSVLRDVRRRLRSRRRPRRRAAPS